MHLDEYYLRSFTLFFVLLNPFLLSIYLIDLITDLETKVFTQMLIRGALISGTVFSLFALGGEAIFTDYLQVKFGSFQVFGGIVFLLIGIRFVFTGADAIRATRGKPEHLAGSIAMPFMIGPGTVSASVVIGARHSIFAAIALIFGTLVVTIAFVIAIKKAHDYMKGRNAKLVDGYIEVVGRVSALLIGTIAVEMIFEGLRSWMK